MHLPWRDVAPGPGPAIPTSVTARETAALQRLAAGKQVLEVGSAYGYSTVALALVAEQVTAVDPHTAHDSYLTWCDNLGVHGVAGKVVGLAKPSREAMPYLAEAGPAFDLIFVDGDHTAAGVELDVTWALKLLRPGGVLACHDYLEDCCCPDVGPTLDGLLGEPGELVDTLAVYRPAS